MDGYTLVIAEKPSSAQKIAAALADGSVTRKANGKVSYYELSRNGENIVVVPAVGHLYGLHAEQTGYPVFDVAWKPSHEVSKASAFTKPYLQLIQTLAKKAKRFIAATDFDVEGEVIAANLMDFACKAKQSHRMKFSTLTKEDLVKAFEHALPSLDKGMVAAGRTRHALDFYWGVSLSRALMHAIKSAGMFKVMSIGRVQGPALALLAKREKEILAFVPTPYWVVLASIGNTFWNKQGQEKLAKTPEIQLKVAEAMQIDYGKRVVRIDSTARKLLALTTGDIVEIMGKKTTAAIVLPANPADEGLNLIHMDDHMRQNASLGLGDRVKIRKPIDFKHEKNPFHDQAPPTPFDLTTLQTEADLRFSFSPARTLEVAQKLYEQAFISYPRTSSQKLPAQLDLPRIISKLANQSAYSKLAGELITKKRFLPNEGENSDPANPAIYPTGETPSRLLAPESQLYDLIVKRFLGTFAEPLVRQHAAAKQALIKAGTDGTIVSVKKSEYSQAPPTPFDLTTLQTEAHRCFGFSPARTLEVAQKLYEQAFISYPRTSSQKLPEQLDLPKIISKLGQQPAYSKLAGELLAKKRFTPNEGKNSDPAHPAIYPTGEAPRSLAPPEHQLYDLIAKRFLATFAEPSVREKLLVEAKLGTEVFKADGVRTIVNGWLEFYEPYSKQQEILLPDFTEGDAVKAIQVTCDERQTTPPDRFSEASLVRKLEEEDLGTKATRSAVIQTLFDRGYVKGKSIEVTAFGMSVNNSLSKYSPQVLSEQLTRDFEKDMENIQAGEKKSEEVLEKGKATLTGIIGEFKDHEVAVGKELLSSFNTTQRVQNTLGKCNSCTAGSLVIRRGKFGQFVGCSAYPNCRNTFPLPGDAVVKASSKACDKCGTPIVLVRRKGKRPWNMCLSPVCETKKDWGKPKEGTAQASETKDETKEAAA